MRTHRVQREIAFLGMNDKNAHIDIERDRVELIAFRLTHVDHRRRLVQNIRRQKLIAEHRSSRGCNSHRAESHFYEELPAVDVGVGSGLNLVLLVVSHSYFVAPEGAAALTRSRASIASTEIKPVGS